MGGEVNLLNQLGKLPTLLLSIQTLGLAQCSHTMPEDGFEPITNEIFNQVHYQLCYFGYIVPPPYVGTGGHKIYLNRYKDLL